MPKKIYNVDLELAGELKLFSADNSIGDILTIDALDNVSRRTASEILFDIDAAPKLHAGNHLKNGSDPISGEGLGLSGILHENYSANGTLKSHLEGIDLALGNVESTTAGLLIRINFTGDTETTTEGTFYLTDSTSTGSTASVNQIISNGDNSKSFFSQDILSPTNLVTNIAIAGSYSAKLDVETEGLGVGQTYQQRFTIEVYLADSEGVPINSGVSGAPMGNLGVNTIAILSSGVISLQRDSLSNINLIGSLLEDIEIPNGNRVRYHISAEKIGTNGGAVDQKVYYGSSHTSYYEVPVPILWGDIKGNLANQVDLQNILNDKEDSSNKGVANGYVPLNGSGLIANQYLPSYVDDVLEYADLASFPGTGETGKLYIALDTNFTYRWSGSAYVQVGGGGAGEVDSVFGRVGAIVAEVGDYDSFYLGIGAKAADSDLFDGINSTQFVRSDVNSSKTGFLRIEGEGNPIRLRGTGTGDSNTVFVSFEDSAGSRAGYIGFPSGSHSNLLVRSDITGKNLILDDNGSLIYDGNRFDLDPSVSADTLVQFIAPGSNISQLNVRSSATSGSGSIYFGEGTSFGGGIEYIGGGTGLSGAGGNYNALYRRLDGVNTWTARNSVGDNDWEFRGNIKLYASGANLNVGSGNRIRRYGSHNSGFLEGGHNTIGNSAAKTNPIFTIGSSYIPGEEDLGLMYGIGYTNGTSSSFLNSIDIGSTPSGWGLYLAGAGVAEIFLEAQGGNGRFAGNLYATNFILSSDKRLKSEVKPLVKDFSDIEFVEFEYNRKKGEKRYGVIAQQVEINHPELVEEDDSGFKQVKYTDLLMAKIAEFESRIKKLENASS